MEFLKTLFQGKMKPGAKNKALQEQELMDIIKNARPADLSFLNKKIAVAPALVLPVAECMPLIEQMDKSIREVHPKYMYDVQNQRQWQDLYSAALAFQIVKSLNDPVLQERYFKFSFSPTVLEILKLPTAKPVSIGPRKISKVGYLDYAKLCLDRDWFQKYTNSTKVNPEHLLRTHTLYKME